ncbi:MAG: hypothetical protein ACYDH5_12505 [Acidimicrobiales bacterium]
MDTWPKAFVVPATVLLVPVPKVALDPELGAVKVTVAPATGPLELVTVATSGLLKLLFTEVLCPLPDVAVMVTVE